ncbi:MAG: trans-aconitate 2-methyltransferase [Thermoleophilaceae bacterium]|nr:trans-aconitate 2-methyltransferase [Thermoleophilaceae bacterium]
MTRDWDAGTYHRVSDVHTEWAEQVLGRLPRIETVLDAGCGSGRVTAMLLERCAHVVAVDAAPSMVAHAQAALGKRATVLQADLLALELDEPVDAVFSNAVFHWVPDHPRLFERLHAALKPGGRLEAQYGGKGNVGKFHDAASEVGAEEPFAAYLDGWVGPWNFTAAEQAHGWLEDAGFVDVRAWLEEWPMTPREPRDYIRTVCLGHHLERLPESLRPAYVDAVADRMPPEIDYVRLNVSARRPGPALHQKGPTQ